MELPIQRRRHRSRRPPAAPGPDLILAEPRRTATEHVGRRFKSLSGRRANSSLLTAVLFNTSFHARPSSSVIISASRWHPGTTVSAGRERRLLFGGMFMAEGLQDEAPPVPAHQASL